MKELRPGMHLQFKNETTNYVWFDFGGSCRTLEGVHKLKKRYERMYAPPKTQYRILTVKAGRL